MREREIRHDRATAFREYAEPFWSHSQDGAENFRRYQNVIEILTAYFVTTIGSTVSGILRREDRVPVGRKRAEYRECMGEPEHAEFA